MHLSQKSSFLECLVFCQKRSYLSNPIKKKSNFTKIFQYLKGIWRCVLIWYEEWGFKNIGSRNEYNQMSLRIWQKVLTWQWKLLTLQNKWHSIGGLLWTLNFDLYAWTLWYRGFLSNMFNFHLFFSSHSCFVKEFVDSKHLFYLLVCFNFAWHFRLCTLDFSLVP